VSGRSVLAGTLALIVLAGCAGRPDGEEMAAAQTALLGEALAYRRCMETNHNLPERCRAEREVYEAERRAFEAAYGRK
jgi:hypothetical protein